MDGIRYNNNRDTSFNLINFNIKLSYMLMLLLIVFFLLHHWENYREYSLQHMLLSSWIGRLAGYVGDVFFMAAVV